MRLSNITRLTLSVVAYFALVGVVCVGGPVAVHKLFSAAPLPGFLAPTNAVEVPVAPVHVEFKEYKPPPIQSRGWTPSLARGFVTKPIPPKQISQAKSELKERSSKSKKRHARRNLSKEAKDAYASGRRPAY